MNRKFLLFLKKYNIYNEDIFKYYENNKTVIGNQDINNGFIGCYPKIENGILKKVKIVVPRIESYVDISINIHEYVHLVRLYNNLGKPIVFTDYEEVLPVLYELLFLNDNLNEECTNYLAYYREFILNSKNKEYIIALNLSNQLFLEYNNDCINDLEEEVRIRFI